MKLSNLHINQTAIVLNITCNDELKKRFYSFGIIKGAIITITNISLTKNTMEINVEDTSIAIRIQEAKTIFVELIK
jgi:ferrous iron transport protein A